MQVEGQGESGFSFSKLLKDSARGLTEQTDEPPTKRGRVSKSTRDDFSVLVVAIVTLGVSFSKMRAEIKPTDPEIDLFSNHISGIMLRHLPISNKLSADALDVIGIIAVMATWYNRVAPEIGRSASFEQVQPSPRREAVKSNGAITTPIQESSIEDYNFLQRTIASYNSHEGGV